MAIARRNRYEAEPVTAPPPAALSGYVVLEPDEWLEARPPAYSRMGERWATIITPVRHCLRFALWVSYTWVRTVALLTIVMAVVAVVLIRIWS